MVMFWLILESAYEGFDAVSCPSPGVRVLDALLSGKSKYRGC